MVWKVKLGGQYRSVSALYLDMQMAGSTGVLTRHQRLKDKTTFLVGKLVSTQLVAPIVVITVFITLPKIQQCARHWSASAVHHFAQ